jgi:uncharacterized protein (TIGR02453 family)
MAGGTGFTGFPRGAVTFYQELEVHNTKDFWAGHKHQWERDVHRPLLALVEALEPEFGPAKVFRPHRDIRFSADKSPYKTHQGAIAGQHDGVGYYVQISGEGLVVGGGFRTHSPAQTHRFRAAVDAEASGTELEGIAADLQAAGFGLEGAALKTRPQGYDADHPRLELLRRKELMAIKRVGTPAWLTTPEALHHVRESWQQVRPLADWVTHHVGPAEEQPRRGR